MPPRVHGHHLRPSTNCEKLSDDRLLHLRQAPAVAVVEEKTSRGACGVLTQVALGPAACFTAFDDLLALTVRTTDGDEGHGPPLAIGHCQEESQGDINFRPSPLLEHYQKDLLLELPEIDCHE